MVVNRIYTILESCASDSPLIPSTHLYNEGWLLRLVLDWFAHHNAPEHPLSFSKGSKWYSEALLPTAFKARHRGDRLSESRTHLDGVVGHYKIGKTAKTDFSLLPDAKQFVACEAKMFSSLSKDVKNAENFDQAARNVACMVEAIRLADRQPSEMTTLGFYVLAPESQIRKGVFSEQMSRESIQTKVEQRVNEYGGEKDNWYREWFTPVFECIDIQILSWEQIISAIKRMDEDSGVMLESFYKKCIEFNS